MRWIGIDEAGYGPNLGPLVMTSVAVESSGSSRPDFWANSAGEIGKAKDHVAALWIDDSKEIFKAKNGFERLEEGVLAAFAAAGFGSARTYAELLEAARAPGEHHQDDEIAYWSNDQSFPVPIDLSEDRLSRIVERRFFEASDVKISSIRSIALGPARFNAGLTGDQTKADVHSGVFRKLIAAERDDPAADSASIVCDKHGGRRYYQEMLAEEFPGAWIDRGVESSTRSDYVVRLDATRRFEFSFRARADGDDSIVAISSMISKLLREYWMILFNAFWIDLIPGLAPTAGYPGDAERFRRLTEPIARELGLPIDFWWRKV
jgi:hypothetical protein